MTICVAVVPIVMATRTVEDGRYPDGKVNKVAPALTAPVPMVAPVNTTQLPNLVQRGVGVLAAMFVPNDVILVQPLPSVAADNVPLIVRSPLAVVSDAFSTLLELRNDTAAAYR